MATIQLKDVLERCQQFHRQAGTYFQEMEAQADSGKMQEVLGFLARHEAFMGRCLQEYEKTVPQPLQNAWFVNVPLDLLKQISFAPFPRAKLDPDEMLQLVLSYEQALMQLYRAMLDNTSSPTMREILERLMALELAEEKYIVQALTQA